MLADKRERRALAVHGTEHSRHLQRNQTHTDAQGVLFKLAPYKVSPEANLLPDACASLLTEWARE